ncbi:Rrf2 family transcriptional regulator [Phenylobacterium sp.]|jgi:Rrf2 family iron-sulfur cluster assembly transcriptional regulator|uniref:Rrf2 family transcriptional regulator n=1 Tax=Phenylobacterium sp. TaxID=1871053 RepID=UPI0035B1B595
MRLSTKGRYAVMAMADLARRQAALAAGDRAVTLADIAQRQQISLSYLEQLFARLRRRGLVKSLRGPGGGYRLAREACETSIADIVLAVDEPLRATRCGAAQSKGCMLKGERCITHDLWDEMGRHLHSYLASVTLADLVDGRFSRREAA